MRCRLSSLNDACVNVDTPSIKCPERIAILLFEYIRCMSKISEEVGLRIRKIRESKDFNQVQIAKKLDITPGAYAKIERGETDPSITRLDELARIFKVDLASLIFDKPITKSSPVTRAELNLLQQSMEAMQSQLQKLQPKKK